MILNEIKVAVQNKAKKIHYSRDLESAESNERIYDEVKDRHKDKNQQSIQHLDNKGEEN